MKGKAILYAQIKEKYSGTKFQKTKNSLHYYSPFQ